MESRTDKDKKNYKKIIENCKTEIEKVEKPYWKNQTYVEPNVGYHEKTEIGYAEMRGKRPTQQDCVAAGSLSPEFSKLPDDLKKQVLELTIYKLQNEISISPTTKQAAEDSGSTLCVVIALGNKIYSANLGDSTAFLFVIGKKGSNEDNKTYGWPLNFPLHTAKERLGGFLAITRSIADNDAVKFGLSHKPDIRVFDIAKYIKKDIQNKTVSVDDMDIFLFNACDGMTESNAVTTDCDIPNIIQKERNKFPFEIATTLVKKAFEKSRDNISVMVTKVEPNDLLSKFMAVFDGHGRQGEKISEKLAEDFAPTLKKYIELAASNIPQFQYEIIAEKLALSLIPLLGLGQTDTPYPNFFTPSSDIEKAAYNLLGTLEANKSIPDVERKYENLYCSLEEQKLYSNSRDVLSAIDETIKAIESKMRANTIANAKARLHSAFPKKFPQ